jgi:hypothetical protein
MILSIPGNQRIPKKQRGYVEISSLLYLGIKYSIFKIYQQQQK